MEPRTSTPEQRLLALEALAKAGIFAGVSLAPVIPGLNDSEMPAILKRASEHGAQFAFYTMVRLPYAVKELFSEWLQRVYPERSSKVINRIKEIRGGKLNDSNFGRRMTGTGEMADTIAQLFDVTCKTYGLNGKEYHFSNDQFVRSHDGQFDLFR